MFLNTSHVVIQGGTFNNSTSITQTNHGSRGMQILLEWVATGAFHNSDELYDAPKCHPRTRVAVLDDIMQWVGVGESESAAAGDEFMMWLFGPAGAGKSAIAKRIAEIAADMGILIATFFFSRTSPNRSNKDRFVPTLAYQLALSIPDTRSYIENAIENDPTIFRKNLQTQIDTLLIKPFLSIPSTQIISSPKLIIIDGLDECQDSQSQVAILEAISRSFSQHNLKIKFLVVSRPELDIDTSFNCNEPLRFIHRRLALDDTYHPDDDIRLFFSDKFKQIKHSHPLRSTIPNSWPTEEILDTLVSKSSGQFIYASTVVKFVQSSRHPPSARLNIILGISSPGRTNPFSELDALYNHILSSVDDIHLTLRVLSFYVVTPSLASRVAWHVSPELFLSLEPGDIQLALIDLPSIVKYDTSGDVSVLHASLVDFLSDKHRSTIFYIDMASTCTDFVHRILQYVKAPDGIQAGDLILFLGVDALRRWIPKGQLRSEILNFDIDGFINASLGLQYEGRFSRSYPKSAVIQIFETWERFIRTATLEDGDKKEVLDRLDKSLESRLQIYQSDWRLQLLLALNVAANWYYWPYEIPYCRCVDILLEMDDHDLHLVDRHALDLRHTSMPWPLIIDLDCVNHYLNHDYALSALHCMQFLSNPPKYSDNNGCPEMGLIYLEWKTTCAMTCKILCTILQWQAHTSSELVQFISNYDIHPAVQKEVYVWDLDVQILAFLSRAGVCPNWRIISAIQRSPIITRHQRADENNSSSDREEVPWRANGWETTRNLIRDRVDQCCRNMHFK